MMSRKIHGENDSERITSDGTAARTRPLSIQDIILQREKKAVSEAKKTREGLQDNDKGASNHLEQERGYKSRKDPKDMPVEASKKEKSRDTAREGSKKEKPRHIPRESPKKEDMRYTLKEVSKKDKSKDRPKGGSKMDDLKDTPNVPEKENLRDAPKISRKERPSIRDFDHLVGKDKGIRNSQKVSSSMSSRADESKDRNLAEIGARNGDAARSKHQKGPVKKWNDETADNDRIKDGSEKLRNETKRKGRSFDSEKSLEVGRPMLKKHDSAQFQDSRYSDRNDGRNEYAKPYRGEPRLKRRRSRSRDHDRERHGRSISPPPREQRHSYRGHGFVNYPPYYSMEKSRRKYPETDKQRTSGSGGYSSGSHQRHESWLGGYSPRKRKTALQAEQATTKTPDPVIQSPEKKSATWDQPPVKEDQPNFLTTLQPTVGQMAPSTPFNFTTLKKDPATKVETILAGNNLVADSIQLTQATRPLRRLHIENLPVAATEDRLIGYLNDLLSSGIKHTQRSKPCLSCTINKDKRQAFVEFLTPEDATAALSFDGRSLNGSALKIRRPKDYVEMANVAHKKPAEEIIVISDVVADSPHKIFIAGIAGVISSEMLMEIVSAFGPLAAYRFHFNEELGGPCAFLEYVDHSITSKACAGLNGMKLGGCVLTVVHVFPNPPAEVDNKASPFYGIPDNAKSLLEEPTKVLQLKDVFDREEYMLLSKSELEETLEDVRMECARFGGVKSVNAVEYPIGNDNTGEGNIVEPEGRSDKIEPTEYGDNQNNTVVPNQSQDQKDTHLPSNAAQSENQAPVEDLHTDLDDTQPRAALPTLQHAESNQMVSEATTDEDNHMEAAAATTMMDDDAVENRHPDPRTLETCSPAKPGDQTEKSGKESEQQRADDVSQDPVEKALTVETREDIFVFEPGSVLVEFMRKEAACVAAHSLHGRRFGNRTVSAGYAPRDLYLQKYPR
ncbi:splicing factor U2af large subunit B-like [Phragmites australis]|uniref:splicing factor U2af large subunit B-like n=1 Tax=Phragmites australis TaxID=29695 RepID=UPI002D799F86|nr:splicing factor U2af large subunit B-like [Phragmites australis]